MSVSLVCLVFSGTRICMSYKWTIVIVLGVSGLLLINICPGIMKELYHIHTLFFDITYGLYTWTNWWWISTRATLITSKNQITLYTLTFGHISRRPAIFQLNVQRYNMHTLPSCRIILRRLQMPLRWWNLMSGDAVSHKACCYLFFLNLHTYKPDT